MDQLNTFQLLQLYLAKPANGEPITDSHLAEAFRYTLSHPAAVSVADMTIPTSGHKLVELLITSLATSRKIVQEAVNAKRGRPGEPVNLTVYSIDEQPSKENVETKKQFGGLKDLYPKV